MEIVYGKHRLSWFHIQYELLNVALMIKTEAIPRVTKQRPHPAQGAIGRVDAGIPPNS